MSCPFLHFAHLVGSRNPREIEMGGGIFGLLTRMQCRLIVPLAQSSGLRHYGKMEGSGGRGELHQHAMRPALQVNNLGCHRQIATLVRFATQSRFPVHKDSHDAGRFGVYAPLAAIRNPDLTGSIENSLSGSASRQFEFSGRKLHRKNVAIAIPIAAHLIFFGRPNPLGIARLAVRAN